ncbi:methyltransferase [Lampropedia cohaerens]|uniref:Prepilin leader peptidase/N-methyltransferase n=1 Tax=Lampropedia cohaerens TaxID=1610491 RepID=A0A0U1Q382_9BURK|nr:A24 family peptidase [Lampropedia cohaerens]KKW69095.1 methyltransferase [Lampropedia cohaerens]
MAMQAEWAAVLAGVLGLLVGSFLNVVIHRVPLMLQHSWRRDSAAFLQEQGVALPEDALPAAAQRLNLWAPRSRCPSCGHGITAWENIPVISYLLLRGQCRSCHTHISLRYPLVEIACALLFAYCGYRWGVSWQALAWAGFSATLLALVCIDWDTTLLPDNMTLPLLWAGLLLSWLGVTATPLREAVLGAIAGYLSLWSVYIVFKLATGKEGMGHGDFKLLAAIGAWLGAGAILPVVLMSSVIGAIVGIALKLCHGLREGGYMPYGPFLGGAGLVVMALGPQTLQHWLDRLLTGG